MGFVECHGPDAVERLGVAVNLVRFVQVEGSGEAVHVYRGGFAFPAVPVERDWRGAGRLAGPGALLSAALSIAPEQGVPVTDLVAATGRSHRWVNYRLRALAESGQVIQVKRGMWRAASPGSDVPRAPSRTRTRTSRACLH